MPNYVLGKDGKLYYSTSAISSTSSTTALNSATLMSNVQDVDTNLSKDTVEITSRASSGFKQKVGTLKDASIKFKILWIPGDTAFNAFRDAYLNDTEIAVWALDQLRATSGTQGLAGNFNVVNFSRTEPLTGAMTADIELVPSTYTHFYGS
jgi:predicted secreted protein